MLHFPSPSINHPIRVAEQIALIDILTNGRVELGTGRGSGSTEVNPFGLGNEDTRELWEEAVRAIEDPDPVTDVVNNKFVTIAPLVCLRDGAAARQLQDDRAGQIDPWFATYIDTVRELAERTKDEPRPIAQSRLREMVEEARSGEGLPGPFARGMTDPQEIHEAGICAGTPDEVAATVARYQDAGVDQLVMLPRLASWMEDEEQVWSR